MKVATQLTRLQRLKIPFLIFLGAVIAIVLLVIIFISPLTKYLIERYDEKYTGRQITMDWAYVNPFTGYVHFNNFKVYEHKSDSIFIEAKGVSMNISLLKLWYKTYELRTFILNRPKVKVIQNKKVFNFSDLIEKFSSKEKPDTNKAPLHLNILQVNVTDGEFYYKENVIPINYFIKKVQFESPGRHWNVDTVTAKFSFVSGIKTGDMKGDFMINLRNMNYRTAVVVHKFDLNIIEQYLKEITNYGSFRANVDADIKAKGNLKDQENLTASGILFINDFHFGKNPQDDYASFEQLVLRMKEVSPRNHSYLIDSITMTHPYFKYERYDYLDNIQTMFGKGFSKYKVVKENPEQFNLIVEIAKYVKVLVQNFLLSYYKINRVAVYRADMKFNDYAISEKFAIEFSPLNMSSNGIDKSHEKFDVILYSDMKPYGTANISLSVYPKGSNDFDLIYHFQKLPMALFNPYVRTFTSFALNKGTVELKGSWTVRDGAIQSNNHLVILEPELTRKIKNNETKRLPLPLIMAFVRERGNFIDYEIPISGNMKDPKFHLHDVLIDVLTNIFVKPATIPVGIHTKNIENKTEKLLTFDWPMLHYTLRHKEEKFIKKMAEFLVKNPDATINIYPQQYEIKEKEYILFYEAKKKYYALIHNINAQALGEKDEKLVEEMSVKDPAFVAFLDKQANTTLLFTIQDKCALIVDQNTINSKFAELNQERQEVFMSYFEEKGVESKVTFYAAVNILPFNGFSFYKIEYKGDLPKLLKDYQDEIDEVTGEAPPKKRTREERIQKRKDKRQQ